MAPNVKFNAPVAITHIGTATAIIHVDGVNLLTDPVFSPAGTEWDLGIVMLKLANTPAMGLADLPPIDAVLLSHEDHPDNLDEPGRTTLEGRHVFTTPDGARNLAPRPGVRAIKPWWAPLLYSPNISSVLVKMPIVWVVDTTTGRPFPSKSAASASK
jgi:L-ascorbate metabolism protein UlaG (beta-lactamase superfamily)